MNEKRSGCTLSDIGSQKKKKERLKYIQIKAFDISFPFYKPNLTTIIFLFYKILKEGGHGQLETNKKLLNKIKKKKSSVIL